MSKKDTLCVLPWMHFSVKPNGLVKPCCRFLMHDTGEDKFIDFSNKKLSDFKNVDDILASQPFEQLRQAMLNGEKLSGCAKCYKEDLITNQSMRTGYNDDYNVDSTVNEDTISLKFLEVTFGNYCNLACRTCNSQLSTSWFEDDKELVKHYPDRELYSQRFNIGFNWKPEDFKNTVHIKFTGGEPMLHPDFVKFLDVIIEGGHHKQITLEIFTNSSWSPKEKLMSTLAKFKKAEIWMSIDGTGEVNDYVRQNSNWLDVQSSIDSWLDFECNHDNVAVILTPTLCAYNIFNMSTLLEYWIDQRSNKGLITINDGPGKVVMNTVYSPSYIAIDILPAKHLIVEKFKSYIDSINRPINEQKIIRRHHNKIIQYLNGSTSNKETDVFIKYTKDVDLLRSQSLEKQIPELYQYLEKNLGYKYNEIKGNIK